MGRCFAQLRRALARIAATGGGAQARVPSFDRDRAGVLVEDSVKHLGIAAGRPSNSPSVRNLLPTRSTATRDGVALLPPTARSRGFPIRRRRGWASSIFPRRGRSPNGVSPPDDGPNRHRTLARRRAADADGGARLGPAALARLTIRSRRAKTRTRAASRWRPATSRSRSRRNPTNRGRAKNAELRRVPRRARHAQREVVVSNAAAASSSSSPLRSRSTLRTRARRRP